MAGPSRKRRNRLSDHALQLPPHCAGALLFGALLGKAPPWQSIKMNFGVCWATLLPASPS